MLRESRMLLKLMSNRRLAMQYWKRQLSSGTLRACKSILKRISPLSTFSSLCTRYKVLGLACRIFFYCMLLKRVMRQLSHADQTESLRNWKASGNSTLSRWLPKQGRIFTRHCSCYCFDCIDDEEENCSNKECLNDGQNTKLERESSVATTRYFVDETEANLLESTVIVADIPIKDSVVAIATANETDYDYYLWKWQLMI